MAKESMKARDRKRKELTEKYAQKRAELRAKVKQGDLEAMFELQKLPRNSSYIRYRNRCKLSGRPRGYMRQFGISRINFREMAANGLIPGIKKRAGKNLFTKKRKEMYTDPIADYLTRIRNAIKARHLFVEIPASKMKKRMTEILFDKGYIYSYKFVDEKPQGKIKIALKYHPVTKESAIKNLERVSKPGLRKYTDTENLPRVLNGLGIAIISTSKGLMTDKEARAQKIGGEVICYVY